MLAPNETIEPEYLHLSSVTQSNDTAMTDPLPGLRLYHEKMEAYSRKVLEDALRRNDWNQTKASDELGLQRTYFTKMLRQKHISGRPAKNSTESPSE